MEYCCSACGKKFKTEDDCEKHERDCKLDYRYIELEISPSKQDPCIRDWVISRGAWHLIPEKDLEVVCVKHSEDIGYHIHVCSKDLGEEKRKELLNKILEAGKELCLEEISVMQNAYDFFNNYNK